MSIGNKTFCILIFSIYDIPSPMIFNRRSKRLGLFDKDKGIVLVAQTPNSVCEFIHSMKVL